MFFGGMPGGMPGGMGGPPKDVDTTKLYETLGVEKNATKKEIRKAYMKLSRTHHPDKGGDEHKFKEISAANEILSDDEKRAQYDKSFINCNRTDWWWSCDKVNLHLFGYYGILITDLFGVICGY